ncbi:MAG TPA: DinB family protein [Candidatus Eisenbacteria bacterium]|nr:DinB family protein [Candidatus Eisenbacteria bacterium]
MAWSFLFGLVHHRGQITTYFRPMGSTVPQIYGPSADEPQAGRKRYGLRGRITAKFIRTLHSGPPSGATT